MRIAQQREHLLALIFKAAQAAVERAEAANDEAAEAILADEFHRRPFGSTHPTCAWHEAANWRGFGDRAKELVADLRRSATREDVSEALYGFAWVPPGAPAHVGPDLPGYAVRLAHKLVGR